MGYTIGPFRLDADARALFRVTEPLALSQRAVSLLHLLVESHGQLVSKNALIEAAWDGRVVEESNLTVQIASLRRVLGAEPGGERWIETFPRLGYRFVGPVPQSVSPASRSMPAVPQASPASAAQPSSAERRQLTIMVCNLVDPHGLSGSPDPEDVRDRIASFHIKIAELVARFNGFVAQYLGDGVHVYFGYPSAREDDAEQAVRAALAIQEMFRAVTVNPNPVFLVGVGLATGLVVVDDQQGSADQRRKVAIGATPNLAIALQAETAPGEVIIAKTTWQLVGRQFDCHALGANETGSSRALIDAWLVRGEKVGIGRFEARRAGVLSPLVGRQEELELLLRRWTQVKAGEGRVVLISGESGIGKSRLTQEFKHRIEADSHFWIECGCAEYFANAPFQAIVQTLVRGLRVPNGDAPADRYARLEQALEPTGMKLDEVVPLIGELIGLPLSEKYPPLMFAAEQRRKRLLAALTGWVFSATKRQPVVFVVEDLHWVDPSTLELLQTLAEQNARAPVLLLSTARPELQSPWPMRAHHAQITLNRLNSAETRELVAGITPNTGVNCELMNAVIERADGVPLFVEELTRHMLDGGSHAREIPTTLLDSLTARLDRIGAAKQVAQIGAVLGREFNYEVLEAVSPLPDGELVAALGRLTAAGLVYARGKAPHSSYQFKHALVQDAAYGTLLRDQRLVLHARVAEMLAGRFSELALPEVLAQHYSKGGLPEKAIHSWQQAGEKAILRSGMEEAISHFSSGLEDIARLPATSQRPDLEIDLRVALAGVLTATKGQAAEEIQDQFLQLRRLSEELGDLNRLFRALHPQWRMSNARADHALGREMAVQILEIGDRLGDDLSVCVASACMGTTAANRGEFTAARAYLERAVAHDKFEVAQEATTWVGWDVGIQARKHLSRILANLGFLDQGARCLDELAQRSQRQSQALNKAYALHAVADFGWYVRDIARVKQATETLSKLTADYSIPYYQAMARFYSSWLQVESGDISEGIKGMQAALDLQTAIGMSADTIRKRGMLADCLRKSRQFDKGLALVDDALSLIESRSEWDNKAEILRIKGELLHECGAAYIDAAQAAFLEAIDQAGRQGARQYELRAATNLAQLWIAQGRKDEARALLMPRYAWFTEGFDFPDLQAARKLLEHLV